MKNDKNKVSNVPNLRFPFVGDWEKYRVSDLLEFFTTNSLSWEQLEYNTENIYNLHYGLIHNGAPTLINADNYKLPNICKEYIPKTYTLCQDGDVAFADASEDTDDVAKVVEFFTCNNKKIVCGLHTIQGRDKLNVTVKGFKGYAFSSYPFHHQIRRLAQGTKVYSISQKNFSECFIGIPSKEEQTKIANLMKLIDDRISTQRQIIEDLKLLKSSICQQIFNNQNYVESVKLGNLCNITTGKLDANAMVNNGLYKFFTCAEDPYQIDNYAFDTEALLISGNGANVGYIHYYNGKFNAYQRTYVLDKVKCNILYMKFYLQTKLHKRIEQEKNTGNTPYIVLTTLTDMIINLTSIKEQKQIVDFLSAIDEKMEIEKQLLIKYIKQKKYLLSNLFI
jgi:type I restriction enzyme S subunit